MNGSPETEPAVSSPGRWQLLLQQDNGSRTTFRLSTEAETHVIVVRLGLVNSVVLLDGQQIVSIPSGSDRTFGVTPRNSLMAPVSVRLSRGSWLFPRLESFVLNIGHQVLRYDSETS